MLFQYFNFYLREREKKGYTQHLLLCSLNSQTMAWRDKVEKQIQFSSPQGWKEPGYSSCNHCHQCLHQQDTGAEGHRWCQAQVLQCRTQMF